MGRGCQRWGEADRGGGGRGRKHIRRCGMGQRTETCSVEEKCITGNLFRCLLKRSDLRILYRVIRTADQSWEELAEHCGYTDLEEEAKL